MEAEVAVLDLRRKETFFPGLVAEVVRVVSAVLAESGAWAAWGRLALDYFSSFGLPIGHGFRMA